MPKRITERSGATKKPGYADRAEGRGRAAIRRPTMHSGYLSALQHFRHADVIIQRPEGEVVEIVAKPGEAVSVFQQRIHKGVSKGVFWVDGARHLPREAGALKVGGNLPTQAGNLCKHSHVFCLDQDALQGTRPNLFLVVQHGADLWPHEHFFIWAEAEAIQEGSRVTAGGYGLAPGFFSEGRLHGVEGFDVTNFPGQGWSCPC